MFVSFERLHRNHKLAFIDGLLCGVFVAWTINKLKRANY
jgi:hypothetical protein